MDKSKAIAEAVKAIRNEKMPTKVSHENRSSAKQMYEQDLLWFRDHKYDLALFDLVTMEIDRLQLSIFKFDYETAYLDTARVIAWLWRYMDYLETKMDNPSRKKRLSNGN